MTALVSVSLVTYDGMRWLPGCLASLADQEGAEFELLVIDNASMDGTTAWLVDRSAHEPRLHVHVESENTGFAAAHNRNIERARGEVVVLLNQDVELDAGFLGRVVEVIAADPTVGAVQGRVLRLDADGARVPIIDTTGLVMQRDRRVLSRDQGRPAPTVSRPAGAVWGVDGPVAVYRRAALLDARLPRSDGQGAEVLDEDFFMYKEDVDLAWRLRLLGWRTVYTPDALAWHARSASGPSGTGWLDIARRNRVTPPWIRARSWVNQRLMQVKNERPGEVLSDLLPMARREILSLAYMTFADPRQLAALPGLARGLPAAHRKRRHLWRRLHSGRS